MLSQVVSLVMAPILAGALAVPPVTLAPSGQLDVDVAVVVDHADVHVVDAVRAAVFAAAKARGGRVVDLPALGLKRALDACNSFACRRDLARRRGAEWFVVVKDDDKTVTLDLFDGDLPRAHVVLTGSPVVLLGGVPDAVDALFEAALPTQTVARARAIARARTAEDEGDLATALLAWREAFALGVDDRAVEIAFARARVAEVAGDDFALERAWDDAEGTLLDAATVSQDARALLVQALLEHRWQAAERAAAIAVADTGPDHDALTADAIHRFDRLSGAAWVDDEIRTRAREQSQALRTAVSTIPSANEGTAEATADDATLHVLTVEDASATNAIVAGAAGAAIPSAPAQTPLLPPSTRTEAPTSTSPSSSASSSTPPTMSTPPTPDDDVQGSPQK
jgi:hypothetical protein